MKKINVGIIGTGFIGLVHIEALRRINVINIKALADTNAKRAREKAIEYDIEKSYGDYRELLKDDEIDSIHICTPNFLHYEMAKEVLLSGKSVVCEKPLAISVEEAQDLNQMSKKLNIPNVVGFNLRFYPLIQQARSMVLSGEIGQIFAVNGTYEQDWLMYPTDYNWRISKEQCGKSRAVADIGSHWMDVIQYITGSSISEVCADFAIFHKVRKKPKRNADTFTKDLIESDDYEDIEIETEDYASVLMHFDKDIHGSMTVNQAAAGKKNQLYFEIFGSKKSIAWSSEKPNELWVGNRNSRNEIIMKDPSIVDQSAREYIDFPGGHNEGFPDTLKHLFSEFYCAKTKKVDQIPTFETGLKEMILSDKIFESAKNRCWIKI